MKERQEEIQHVTIWGAAANIALSGMKLLAGIAGKSSAMMADAVHSMSDVVSDVIVLVMVKLASKGEDHDHDYGHGKFETLATAGVALLLIVAGAELLASSITKIKEVISGGEIATPGMIALVAALLSIIVKEILYQWTAKVGKKHNSPAVVTNAWHHRSDALSSVGSALGIGLSIILGGKWSILDPIVGGGISVFIFYIAVKMAIPALNELTEASLPEAQENEIHSIIMSVKGVEDVHAMRTRKNGPKTMIESHIVVNPNMSVAEAHDITTKAEAKLREKYGDETHISLHVEPSPESD